VIAEQRRESQYLAERPEGDIESGDIAEISDFWTPFVTDSTDRSNGT